jgi:hypothetical protein
MPHDGYCITAPILTQIKVFGGAIWLKHCAYNSGLAPQSLLPKTEIGSH